MANYDPTGRARPEGTDLPAPTPLPPPAPPQTPPAADASRPPAADGGGNAAWATRRRCQRVRALRTGAELGFQLALIGGAVLSLAGASGLGILAYMGTTFLVPFLVGVLVSVAGLVSDYLGESDEDT